MSIKLRFLLVAGVLLLGFVGVIAVLHQMDTAAAAEARSDLRRRQLDTLRHWVETDVASLTREARVLATTATGSTPRDGSNFDAVGWIDAAGHPIDAAGSELAELLADLPLQQVDFRAAALGRSGRHFYFGPAGNLHEAWIEPAGNGSRDRWLVASRVWTGRVARMLEALSGANLTLADTTDPIALALALPGWNGEPAAFLRARFAAETDPAPALSPVPWFIAFGVFVVAGLALGLSRWVLHPLDRISASLATGDATPLRGLPDERNELGRVARLIESSFAQRDELRRSEAALQEALQERIRLGRNLHDSVIQSLYATGMGLAGIRARLREDQSDVLQGLELSRGALNETIADLRNFITGLEPEALRDQTFGEAVANLLAFAAGVRPLQTECHIDDALAGRLSLTQRANILQITREAVSNALRHGRADRIQVDLHADGDALVFAIRDNGCGFNPAASNGHGGHGLDNLAGRARDIGARLTLDSQPGQGTQLRLTFRLPPPPSL